MLLPSTKAIDINADSYMNKAYDIREYRKI